MSTYHNLCSPDDGDDDYNESVDVDDRGGDGDGDDDDDGGDDGDVNGDDDDGSGDGGRVPPHRQQRRPLRRLHLLLLLGSEQLQCQTKTIILIAIIPGFDFVHHFDRPRLVEPA